MPQGLKRVIPRSTFLSDLVAVWQGYFTWLRMTTVPF